MAATRTGRRIAAGLACVVLGVAVVVALRREGSPALDRCPETRMDPLAHAAPSGTSRLVGTVRRAGAPTAARVEIVRLADVGAPGRARSEAAAMLLVPVAPGPRPATSEPPMVVPVGDDGAFACDVATGIHRLRAVAADGASATTVVVAAVAGARREATLDLVPPEALGAIAGRVRSLDGRPFAGEVRVARAPRRDARAEDRATARPGPDGAFRVDGLEQGPWWVQAVADDGRRSAMRDVVVPATEPVDLDVEAGARWATGRVVAAEDGAPVRGASVVSFGGEVRHATRTDGDGRYRLLLDTSTARQVVVGAPGRAAVDVPSTDGPDLGEVRLERLGRVRGRVRRADGGVVPVGATVRLALDEEFGRFLGAFAIATDADGGFDDAEVPAGRYVVAASADGFVGEVLVERSPEARLRATVDVPAGGEAVVDVVVVPAAEAGGWVLDATGRPAVGVVVRATPSTAAGSRGTETPLPFGLAAGGPPAVTGADGTFRLSGLVPGVTYELGARDAAELEGPPRRVRPRVGTRPTVTLTLPAPRFVDVVVRERANGRPVAGAEVASFVVLPTPESEPDDELSGTEHFVGGPPGPSAVTDDAGHARLGPFGAGEVLLHVRRAGRAPSRTGGAHRTVAGGPGGLVATIDLDPVVPWAGRVVRPDGSPAIGAEVTVFVGAADRQGDGRAAWTDADGRFGFDDVAASEVELSASLRAEDLYAPTRRSVAEETPVTLRLQPAPLPGFVLVRVLDPDGRPVAHANVIGAFGEVHASEFVTAGRALLDLRAADAGRPAARTGTLEVRDASDERGRPLPVGVASVDGVRPGTVVEVRLPRERTIEGRVVGPDGRGVAGVRVVAVAATGPEAGWWTASPWMWSIVDGVRSDGDGRFRVGRLGDGAHLVAALPTEAWAPTGPVPADTGARDVVLRLRAADVATVTVRDADGRPVEGATVVAADVDETMRDDVLPELLRRDDVGPSATTDAAGVARLGGLDAARGYLLGVRPPATRPELVPHVDARWRPGATAVALAPGLEVAGMVVGAAGTPVAGVDVTCVDALGVARRQTTRGDGAFRFRGLSPGEVEVVARWFDPAAPPATRASRGSRAARAGDAGLRLVLD